LKTVFVLVSLLLCSTMVFASIPKHSSTELFINDVNNGMNNLGDILFLSQSYTPHNHIKNSISSFSVQQYDILKWIGSESIKIKNPSGQENILVNGSEYYFSVVGNYIISSLINSSKNETIVVFVADKNYINLTLSSIPAGFDMTFSKSNFILNNEEIIKVYLDVDEDVKTGSYSLKYNINGVEKTKNIRVLENKNWTMDTRNVSKNILLRSGETSYLGRIVVEHKGNTDVQFSIQKFGNGSNLIGVPQPQTLFRKGVILIDLQSYVPTIQKTGYHIVSLNLTGGDISKILNINITIIDNIKPTIEQINFSTDNVFVMNDISVIANDNIDVTNVTMRYDNQIIHLIKDKNLFTTQVRFTKLSRYVIEFCAIDSSKNQYCKEINKTFVKTQIIDNFTVSHTMPSVKYGQYSRVKLFTITRNIPDGVSFTILDVSVNVIGNITRPIFRLVDRQNSIKQFPEYGSISITETGDIYFEVRADSVMDIDGVVRVEYPDHYQEVSDITFKVSFKSYDVPEDFSVGWVDGRTVVCDVKDTGDLSSSYYNCNIQYPVNIKPNDISIPTTIEERNRFKEEVELIKKDNERIKTKSGWYISILLGILIVLFIFTLYVLYWYPLIRFQTGAKLQTKSGKEL